jgi:hypothetical protein
LSGARRKVRRAGYPRNISIGGVVDHPYSWLKYVDAGEVSGPIVDFDGMDVESPEGEPLGVLEGFIVDSDNGRPYYAIVDSKGWFKSTHFLLPVGHTRLQSDEGGHMLVAGVSRERIDRFPGFDKTAFAKLSAEDLARFNDETCAACNITVDYLEAESRGAAWDRPDYSSPEWWSGGLTRPEQQLATEPGPHAAGRAQPGDVVGIETGGERTHIGETGDDENRRLESAERSARKSQR